MRPPKQDRTQVKQKYLQIRITETLRNEFREYCSKNGIKMANVFENAIKQVLENDKKQSA